MIGLFLMNILLSIAWGAVSGSFSVPNLFLGFVISSLVLWMIREQTSGIASGLFKQTNGVSSLTIPFRVISLAGLFFYELILSAVKVAQIVIQPKIDIRPGIFAYPLKARTDFEITLLANLITLTPGTLSVDVSADKKILYIHAIDIDDLEKMKQNIAEGFERKIMETFQ